MRAGHVLVIGCGEREGDQGAEVAALRDIPVIAQAAHQLGPRPRDPHQIPAGFRDGAGEPVAGDGRDDQMERTGRVTGVRTGVVERPDNVEELRH